MKIKPESEMALGNGLIKYVFALNLREYTKPYKYLDPEVKARRRQRYALRTVQDFICRMQIIILKHYIRRHHETDSTAR